MLPADGEACRRRRVFQPAAAEQVQCLWFSTAVAMAALVAAPQHQLELAARCGRRRQVR